MNIIIIGLGRMGLAQAKIARSYGDNIIMAVDSDTQARERFLTLFPDVQTKAIADPDSFACTDLVWLTVNDDAIESVAQKIAPFLDVNTVVLHTSGALSSNLLKKHCHAHVGSLHPLSPCPLVTASDSECLAHYRRVIHVVEGDVKAVEMGNFLTQRLNTTCIAMDSERKPLYHASAVIASNYPIILLNLSVQLFMECGFDQEQALSAAKQLCSQSLELLDHALPMDALTGPVKRGDLNTIKAHEKVLQAYPDALDVYCAIKEAAFHMLLSNREVLK